MGFATLRKQVCMSCASVVHRCNSNFCRASPALLLLSSFFPLVNLMVVGSNLSSLSDILPKLQPIPVSERGVQWLCKFIQPCEPVPWPRIHVNYKMWALNKLRIFVYYACIEVNTLKFGGDLDILLTLFLPTPFTWYNVDLGIINSNSIVESSDPSTVKSL